LQPEEATAAATAAVAAAATAALFLAQDHSRLLTIVTMTLAASPAILNGARRKESRMDEKHRDATTSYAVSATYRGRFTSDAEICGRRNAGRRESLRNYRRRIPVEAYPFLLAVV